MSAGADARPRLAADAADALAEVRVCCFCPGRAVFVGAFVPAEPWLYCPIPPTPGKLRLFFYGVCGRCSELGFLEVAERVEAKLQRGMRGEVSA